MRYILAITFIFIVIVSLVSPLGEFPLNDDWAYTLSVESLVNEGEFRLASHSVANLVTQVYWGSLFVVIFGFSFTILRISTLVLSLVALIAFYLVLTELGISKPKSFIGSLILFSNPLFFNLSYTFMTEVPFLSLFLLSNFFFIKWIKKNSSWYFLLGIVFSILAFLIRQNGLLIPVPAILILLFKKEISISKILILVLWLTVIIGFFGWYYFDLGVTPRYAHSSSQLYKLYLIPIRVLIYGFITWAVISFYGAPFILHLTKKFLNKNFAISLILVITAYGLYFTRFGHWPFEGILSMSGFGSTPYMPFVVWYFIVVISAISSAALLAIVFENMPNIIISMFTGLNFLHISTALQVMFIIITPSYFDRYVIIMFPSLIFILMRLNVKGIMTLAKYVIIFSLLFSSVLTVDYFAWNKVRWDALNSLTSAGIHPTQIDGGFEFNGYYLSEYMFNLTGDNYHPSGQAGKLYVYDDTYIVGSKKYYNYDILNVYEYPIYLGLKTGQIYILKRVDPA